MKKTRKKSKSALISNIIFSLITLASLVLSMVLLWTSYGIKKTNETLVSENDELREYTKEHTYTYEDVERKATEVKSEENGRERAELLDDIKLVMSEGNSAYYLLRYLYPEDVVLTASSGFEFIPIDKSLPQNRFDVANYTIDEETGEISYSDGNTVSMKGIDVSSHQKEIDWKKVKEDGVEFAIIRVGYRGSTEGALKIDEYFEDNIKGAINNGIKVGVYFYTQAMSTAEAIEEAEFVIDAIKDYKIEMPVAYDIESTEGGRANELTQDEYNEYAIAFLEKVREAGYTPMVYGNLNSLFRMMDIKTVTNYDTWFAYYSSPVYYPYEFAIWQYSAKGSVSGIKGDVDINICLKAY